MHTANNSMRCIGNRTRCLRTCANVLFYSHRECSDLCCANRDVFGVQRALLSLPDYLELTFITLHSAEVEYGVDLQ